MPERDTIHCTNCGAAGDAADAYCVTCGASRATPAKRLAGHLGFLLNELGAEPMREVLDATQRASLTTHYEAALAATVTAPVVAPQAAVAPTPPMAAPRVQRAAPVPVAPRPAYDWSWLAEQQANLFLFAGAFLTVVAALIYVGYSGQAVSGALKMSLLALYTLAFLAAGYVCRRIPRVEGAGRVFFAVGAILVPMNFVAARNVLSDEDLSAEAMWLAGSAVSALFYAAVAWIGLGRAYAFASGAAVLSATLAALTLSSTPAEWWPIAVIGVSFGMLLTDIAATGALKERIGSMWRWQAQPAAVLALLVALAIAPMFGDSDIDLGTDWTTRWYLPLTFAAFMLAAGIAARRTGETHFAAGAVAGFAGAFIGVAYAFDLRLEGYAIAFGALALTLMAAAAAADGDAGRALPARSRDLLYYTSLGATAFAATLVASALLGSAEDFDPYVIGNRWFVLASAVAVALAFAVDAFALRTRLGVTMLAMASMAVTGAALYGFDAPNEWYAFALIGPAVGLAAAARFGSVSSLHALWHEDVFVTARIATIGGLLVAVYATEPVDAALIDWRWYLPLAFAAAAFVAGIDASRGPAWETTSALAAAMVATVLAGVWALEAAPEAYGIALAATGIALAMSGRTWQPSWTHTQSRDVIAASAITSATVPFWGAYADAPRAGAGVHLAAAFFFGMAAITDCSTRTLGTYIEGPLARVRVAAGWVYAASFSAVVGYVFVLRSLPAADDATTGSLTMPLVFAAVACAAAGMVARQLRPEFRMHLYVASLLTALAALTFAPDAHALAIALTVLLATYAIVAVYEDEPLLGAPALVFGIAAVPAWIADRDAAAYLLPVAYASAGLALYGAGFALRGRMTRWSDALRAAGAVCALIAPVAGTLRLSSDTSGGLIGTTPFQETGLYAFTTVAVAIVGIVALIESSLAGRRWIIVPASATLVFALLLQIGRFNPENVQAYTVVAGAYLIALGAFGLGRYRLIPELTSSATAIEAIGAVTIMLPSFVQSFGGGWQYQVLLIAEAAVFLTASVVTRRRGVLAVSVAFLVLTGGRALFDAVYAMPNWIVAMIAGVALLAIGVGILAGRERWDRWQQALLTWWGEADGALAP